ncbi:MAG: hypothetical protein RBT62_12260 [Spirochaetia bacterium]|nr:hypothetical protein [Spirochaetia bacterium]
MNRYYRLLPVLLISIFVFSSCRSPVLGRSRTSLSISLSIPADLSSTVPEPIRRAIGEVELSGSRPRLIHPDARFVKAEVIQGGLVIANAEATIASGDLTKSLSFDSIPLDVTLTLHVSLYDATSAKVGESNIELSPLLRARPVLTITMRPLSATPLEFLDGSAFLEGLATGERKVYSFSLASQGLYSLSLNVNGELPKEALTELYASDGTRHRGFVADPGPIGQNPLYGLFGNDRSGESLYYVVVTGPVIDPAPPAPPELKLELDTMLNHDLAVLGATYYSSEESEVIMLPPESFVNFGYINPDDASHRMTFSLYNPYQSVLSIKAFTVDVSGPTDAFSPPAFPPQPLSPGAIRDFVISYSTTENDYSNSNFTIDVADEGLDDFTIVFTGSASCF